MGNATSADKGVFHQERVRANHQAMGVPTSNKMIVVRLASLSVTSKAGQIALNAALQQDQKNCTESSIHPQFLNKS
jgi:hypothetical protein